MRKKALHDITLRIGSLAKQVFARIAEITHAHPDPKALPSIETLILFPPPDAQTNTQDGDDNGWSAAASSGHHLWSALLEGGVLPGQRLLAQVCIQFNPNE